MANKDVMARLKKKSGSFKKKQEVTEEVTHVSPAPILSVDYVDGDYELTQDNKLNSFLKVKAIEIKNVEAASRIEQGKVLAEVYNNLAGKNQYDGLYEKWLEEVEINKRTALRHRKRYDIYSKVKNENGKQMIAGLPERIMDKLHSHEKFQLIVKEIDSGIDKNQLKNMLEEEVTHVSPAMLIEEKPVVSFYKPVFTFERKIAKMTSEEKEKAKEEIKAIIEEAKRLEKLLYAGN